MKNIILKVILFFQNILLIIFDIFLPRQDLSNKFVIGVDEIANNIFLLKDLFKDKAISVCFLKDKFFISSKYDYELSTQNYFLNFLVRIFYGPYLLVKLSRKCKTFIYIWHTGFCVDRELDLKFLKRAGRKIISIFVGSDIRSNKLLLDYLKKDNYDFYLNYIDREHIEKNEQRVKKLAYITDKFSDLIFVGHPINQMSYLKRKEYFYRFYIPDDSFECNREKFKDMNKIKIVHAPSNPIIKGTPLVRAAIKKLKIEGYDFEYIELMDIPNEEVLRILKDSHIVLNQFYMFAPGLFGIEAMAKCNAVLMSADNNYFYKFHISDSPWLITPYWDIYTNLKFLLDNPNEIKKIAIKGFDFAKKYFSKQEVKEYYMTIFKDNNII